MNQIKQIIKTQLVKKMNSSGQKQKGIDRKMKENYRETHTNSFHMHDHASFLGHAKPKGSSTRREIKTETRTYQSQQQVPGAMKLVPVPFLSKLGHFFLEEIKSDTFSFGCLCHTYFPKRREEKDLHERARSKKKAI
jgi:hypothetical protein